MEKTVLNQLLDWCNEFDNKNYHPTHTNMKEKIWELLPKEEEQMIRAYEKGVKDCCPNANIEEIYKKLDIIFGKK